MYATYWVGEGITRDRCPTMVQVQPRRPPSSRDRLHCRQTRKNIAFVVWVFIRARGVFIEINQPSRSRGHVERPLATQSQAKLRRAPTPRVAGVRRGASVRQGALNHPARELIVAPLRARLAAARTAADRYIHTQLRSAGCGGQQAAPSRCSSFKRLLRRVVSPLRFARTISHVSERTNLICEKTVPF